MHPWVGLITETIKAGAFEQSTRRVFKAGSFWQKKLMWLIPEHLKEKRMRHLVLSKEKVMKLVSLYALLLELADYPVDGLMKASGGSTVTSYITSCDRTRKVPLARMKSYSTVLFLCGYPSTQPIVRELLT